MSIFAQGSELYFIDPDTNTVMKVDCPTGFNPGGAPADPVEDTCLDSTTRTYKRGLRTPGQAAVNLNADPQYASHGRLFDLSLSDDQDIEDIKFAIGWSDGRGIPPTVDSNGDFILPTTRTWYVFNGYVADFPFDFQTNTLVTSAVSIQRSGPGVWTRKVSAS